MPRRIPHATEHEYWSDQDQGLHHDWESQVRDDRAHLRDPADYSAIGGPEGERSYGRSRNDSGRFPFVNYENAPDRDTYGEHDTERGGYLKRHNADYDRSASGVRSHRGVGPRDYRRPDETIYAEVCEALTDDAEVDATHIEVRVEEGEVTLTGAVSNRDQKRRAQEIADRVSGVRDIHNTLRVALQPQE